MPATPGPIFRHLTPDECGAIVGNGIVGRLAFAFKGRVDIEPLHYVSRGDWIYFRTQPGTKLTMLAHHPWAALAVDQIESAFNWKSVVVHGTVRVLDGEGTPIERERYRDAIDALRTLSPDMFTAADPAPFRSVIVGMHVAEVTGRSASWAGEPSP